MVIRITIKIQKLLLLLLLLPLPLQLQLQLQPQQLLLLLVSLPYLVTTLLDANQVLVQISVDSLQLKYQASIALLKWHCVLLTMRLLHSHTDPVWDSVKPKPRFKLGFTWPDTHINYRIHWSKIPHRVSLDPRHRLNLGFTGAETQTQCGLCFSQDQQPTGTAHWSEGSLVQRATGLGFNVMVRDVSARCDCLTESLLTSIMW